MKSRIFLTGCLIMLLGFAACSEEPVVQEQVVLTSLDLSPKSVSLTLGNTQQLNYSHQPSDVSIVPVWTSRDASVATISHTGLVTAVGRGSTSVKVAAGGIETSIPVIVSIIQIPLEDIEVPESISIKFSEVKKINYELVPETATDIIVAFESDDETVLTVSEDGSLRPVTVGKVNVKVKVLHLEDGELAEFEKEIPIAINVNDFTVSPASITMYNEDMRQITVTSDPEDAASQVIFESSDESVATVDENGLVTGLTGGQTTITATIGEVSREVAVTVIFNNPDEPSKNTWTATATSAFESNTANRAIDASNSTYWRTNDGVAFPQAITVDMGAPKNIDGVLFTNRQDKGLPCHPKHIVIEVSGNGTDWDTVYETEDLADRYSQQILALDEQASARYFRLTVNSVHGGAEYACITELGIYSGDAPEPNPGSKADWTVPQVSSTHSTTNELGPMLIDGNLSTIWHSKANDASAKNPWIIVDFGSEETFYGVEWWNRSTGGNIASYRASPKFAKILIGSHPDPESITNWNTEITWEVIFDLDNIPFMQWTPVDYRKVMQTMISETPHTARFLKYYIEADWNNRTWICLAELDIQKEKPSRVEKIDLTFTDSGINNIILTDQGNGESKLEASGADPYIFLENINLTWGSPYYACLKMEYKVAAEVNSIEWYFFPSAGSHYTTASAETPSGDSPTKTLFPAAADWTSYEQPIDPSLTFESTLSNMRLDLPDGKSTAMEVRNLRLELYYYE